MSVKRFVLSALLFLAVTGFAQTELEHSVRGVVKDAVSGRPVPAVSVSVPGQGRATVTNADGTFVIKSNLPIRELSFSHIGYYASRCKVGATDLAVRLTPVAYPLPEASIIFGDPFEIVQAAISKIEENYPAQPELLRCFYRETLQKRQRYISVNEAVARIYKTPYRRRTSSFDRTALEKSRIIMSQRTRDTLSVRMMGGPTLAASFDVVKEENVVFNETDLPLYSYKMESPAYIGNRLHFVVSFRPTYDAPYALYFGKLYIDRETLAFSRIELSLDMSDLSEATALMLVRKPIGLRFTPKELSYVVTYRSQDGGPMRLEYFRSSMSFNCDWRRHMIATSYTVVNELVVTDRIEPAAPIARYEQFRPSDILDDKAAEFLDPEFWKDYNIIEPSESLENAVNKLKKHQ